VNLTEDHLEVLYHAWAASRGGGGIVLKDPGLYVEAHELAEHGWLTRKFVGPDREMAWFWSREAEAALDMTQLMQGAEGREN
jgi:hypothetical protein